MLISFVLFFHAAYGLFHGTFGDNMVLQRSDPKIPKMANLYGQLKEGSNYFQNKKIQVEISSLSSDPYTLSATSGVNGTWRVQMKPVMKPGGNYTISVTCIDCDKPLGRTITNVTFGDVFFCSGQSNMWLPVSYTFPRNDTFKALKAGKYHNIRLFNVAQLEVNDPVFVTDEDPTHRFWQYATNDTVNGFSATCWYFAQHLTDRIGDVPMGLIHTGIGGSRLEQWTPKEAQHECKDLIQDQSTPGCLFYGMAAPHVNMTIKMVLWYQGENNVKECCDPTAPHGPINCDNLYPNQTIKVTDKALQLMITPPLGHRPHYGGPSSCGNYAKGTGYACGISKLVSSWREFWRMSEEELPFMIVTIAAATSEGNGANAGSFRSAQMGSFSYAPSPALPNTLVTQGYDIGDPWTGHCGATDPKHPGGPTAPSCSGDAPWSADKTHFYMGPIHPRDKGVLGERMAKQAFNMWYDESGTESYQGPVMSGCKLNAEKNEIEVFFNTTLLRSDTVSVGKYNETSIASGMQVQKLGNTSVVEDLKGEWDFAQIMGSTSRSIIVKIGDDRLPTDQITGVRYAWTDNPCCPGLGDNYPCPPESCPVKTTKSKLPAAPFLAQIINGVCKCVEPFECNDS